jgi:hypothetical protein
MADSIPEGWVRIQNPDLPGDETADVLEEAFEETWRDKGYKVVQRPVGSSEPEHREALLTRAESLGVKVSPSAKTETIEERVAEAERAKSGGES